MVSYPKTKSEKVLFRDLFINSTYVEDNNGTVTGTPTISDGLTGDGSGDYVSYPSITLPDEFNISFWYTPSAFGVSRAVIGQYETGVTKWGLFHFSSGLLRLITSDDGGAGDNIYTGYTLVLNTRVHIGFSVKNSTKAWELFINGVSQGTITADHTFLNTFNSPLNVLNITGLNQGAGKIENLTIGDGLLTADEFLDIYQQDTFTEIDDSKAIVALNLKSHYNDGSNEVTKNNGTADNPTWGDGSTSSSYPSLVFPNGITTSTGDYINCGAIMSSKTQFSVSILAKPSLSGNYYLWSILESGGSAATGVSIIGSNFGGIYNGGSNAVDSGVAYTINELHHFIVTIDMTGGSGATVMKIYYNGELVATDSTITINNLGGDLTISKASNSFIGNLYYPRVFDGLLTPTQCRQLYQKDIRGINR